MNPLHLISVYLVAMVAQAHYLTTTTPPEQKASEKITPKKITTHEQKVGEKTTTGKQISREKITSEPIAEQPNSHALFLNVRNVHKPLANLVPIDFHSDGYEMAQGEGLSNPTLFSLNNTRAYVLGLNTTMYAGFHEDVLVFGNDNEIEPLVIEKDGKLNGTFHACEVSPGSKQHFITRKSKLHSTWLCFPVTISCHSFPASSRSRRKDGIDDIESSHDRKKRWLGGPVPVLDVEADYMFAYAVLGPEPQYWRFPL